MRLERISLPVESDVLVLGDVIHLDKSTNSLDSADRVTRKENGTLQQATWRWDRTGQFMRSVYGQNVTRAFELPRRSPN